MPILLLILGLALPRVVVILLFLFSDWFFQAFDTIFIPLLGFIFLPYTLLWFSVVQNLFGGTWGLWQSLFIVLAFMFDLSGYSIAQPRRSNA